jgi:transcriptional regulator with XRE-family HTH domain
MGKQYKSVVEMLNDVSDDKEFNRSVEKEINTRQIAKTLVAMRSKAALNQAEIAKRMNCTQGKVSKMENSLDADISLGDLVKYCSAVNMQLEIGFFDRRLRMVDKVKHYFFRLKGLIDEIIEISKGDDAMEREAEKFAREAFFNVNLGLFQCLEKAKVKKEMAAPLHVSTPVNFKEETSSDDPYEQKKLIVQTT